MATQPKPFIRKYGDRWFRSGACRTGRFDGGSSGSHVSFADALFWAFCQGSSTEDYGWPQGQYPEYDAVIESRY